LTLLKNGKTNKQTRMSTCFSMSRTLSRVVPCASDLVAAACNQQTPKAKQINKSENLPYAHCSTW
jgi:hypothetical protein